MTAISASRAPRASRYGFGQAARMEWIKLRSQRYPKWLLPVTAAGMIAVAVIAGRNTSAHLSAAQLAGFDPTNSGLAGLAFAQLVIGVLGVLVMTSEYSSGLIRATLAAIPDRRLVLAAKVAVFSAAALVLGQIMTFAAFFALRAALPASVPHPALGQPGVLRAVLMGGLYLWLAGLIGIGLGAIVKNTAAAITSLVGLLFAVSLVLLALPSSPRMSAERFTPSFIAANSLTAVKHVSPSLPAWAGLGLLCLYAAVLLGAGGWLLCRRDA